MSSFLQAVRNSEFYSGNRKQHLAAALLWDHGAPPPPSTSSIQSLCQDSLPLWEMRAPPLLSSPHLPTLCKSGWCKKNKRSNSKKEGCRIWVVGIALTASLWPHWFFSFCVEKCPWAHWDFLCLLLPPHPQPLLSLYFLPSYTVGRFCSVWNMIL